VVEHSLTAAQCHSVVQRSRFSVVPLLDPDIASGQVTVIESMRMNRPVIATRSIGTMDYIRDSQTGTLVPPHEPEALAAAMLQLWDDESLRQRFARNAAEFAEESLSDPAAARALGRIISELERER
jgi:glycosyltransferase involved in cell wall biosynthesis